MTNTQHSTPATATEATSPQAALWRIAVSEYEAECVAYAEFEVRYKAICRASDEGEDVDVFAFERAELDPYADRLFKAREKLFATPAPDAEALIYKLDVLLPYLTDCASEDLERVQSIDADVRRLLGGK